MEKKNTMRKYFLNTMIISLSITALIAIGILLFGKFGTIENKILITTLAVGFASLAGLCCSSIINVCGLRSFSIFGILSACVSFSIANLMIWTQIRDPMEQVFGTASVVMIVCSHTSLLLLIKINSRTIRDVLYATIVCIAIVAIMYIIVLWSNKPPGEYFFRLMGVIAILDVLGTILTPMLNKIQHIKDHESKK